MKGYLLDTSICVALFRGNNVRHFEHIEGLIIDDWI